MGEEIFELTVTASEIRNNCQGKPVMVYLNNVSCKKANKFGTENKKVNNVDYYELPNGDFLFYFTLEPRF